MHCVICQILVTRGHLVVAFQPLLVETDESSEAVCFRASLEIPELLRSVPTRREHVISSSVCLPTRWNVNIMSIFGGPTKFYT